MLNLECLVKSRQVDPDRATSINTYYRCGVSKLSTCDMPHSLIPITQMRRDSFPQMDTPIVRGCPFYRLLHLSLGELCVARMVPPQAHALSA
jgi:hypothetical protein